MKIYWGMQGFNKGQVMGMSIHNLRMKRALSEAGAEIILDAKQPFDIAVHIDNGGGEFRPVHGKPNIYFGTVESAPYPTYVPENIAEAAAFVVPSSFCVPVVRTAYKGPIHVCPEGSDPELFPYVERTMPKPDEPFRFLHVATASSGPRKGQGLALAAFATLYAEGRLPKNAQLYIKTTGELGGSKTDYFTPIVDRGSPSMQPASGPRLPGIIVDRYEMSTAELAKLYAKSHAFLAPSTGEAWGLSLSDALASGLPSAWTHWSGVTDFATGEEFGYPIREFNLVRTWLKMDPTQGRGKPSTYQADISIPALMSSMEDIYYNYPEALRRGRAASEHMHSQYTWAHAAARFLEICKTLV